jgi:hypothetical protein
MVKQTHSGPAGEVVGGKISASEVGYDKDALTLLALNDKENSHFIFRVKGMATDVSEYVMPSKPGEEAQKGYGFVGQFEATNRDGESFAGSVLYLPKVATAPMAAAIRSGNDVMMALDIFITYDKESATSYVYEVRTLLPQDRSAIEEIDKMIGNTPLPALPAPK